MVLGVGDFEELMDKFLEPFILGVHLSKIKVNSLLISFIEEMLFSLLPFNDFGSKKVMFFGIELVENQGELVGLHWDNYEFV